MSAYYRDFAAFLSEHFTGKVQKISVDAGLSCPNRDGTISTGGCSYCNNATFSPGYCHQHEPVEEQLHKGTEFFARKYTDMRYLAYFQSYTGTHGEVHKLIDMYRRALNCEGVVGLIIGTRPDCVPDQLLDELLRLKNVTGRFVMFEFGAESSHDTTLATVNRCHTWAQTVDAVERTKQRGFCVGLHFINGLPGETCQMMLETVDAINCTDIDTVKFHQLQIVRGTRMARQWQSGELIFNEFTLEGYIDHCVDIVARLKPEIAIERFTSQSPDELLISPRWGVKNYQFTNLLNNRLAAAGVTQGCRFTSRM